VEIDDAVRLRRAVHRLARAFNSVATDEGLTPTQASVLGTVVNAGPLTVANLADIEHLNPTLLSRVIGKLVDAEYVQRRPDPNDLRSAIVEATAAGRRLQKRVIAQRAAVLIDSAADLSADETQRLLAALPVLEKISGVELPVDATSS
jgi:DNA-binding MarR family transcriptional regulator